MYLLATKRIETLSFTYKHSETTKLELLFGGNLYSRFVGYDQRIASTIHYTVYEILYGENGCFT